MTAPDGNCFYRTMSLGLYGHEEHHLQLRLQTTIEIALNRIHYDVTDPDYLDHVHDGRIVQLPYIQPY